MLVFGIYLFGCFRMGREGEGTDNVLVRFVGQSNRRIDSEFRQRARQRRRSPYRHPLRVTLAAGIRGHVYRHGRAVKARVSSDTLWGKVGVHIRYRRFLHLELEFPLATIGDLQCIPRGIGLVSLKACCHVTHTS